MPFGFGFGPMGMPGFGNGVGNGPVYAESHTFVMR